MSGGPQGNLLVAVTLIGWFPAVLAMFTFLPPRRAAIAGFMIAWMFLPVAEYQFSGLPELNKMTVTSITVLLGVMIFDTTRLINLRPHWYDVPILAFCLVPFASSLSNDLGVYDGASESFRLFVRWGIPYLIGRMYFSTLQGLRELAFALFIGGLIYIPLCLYEMRMSPQLHQLVYGYHQHSFIQHYRFGGWRPKVFMQHGLMVGMFMTSAALSGLWLWRSGTLKSWNGLPAWVFVFPLLLTALFTRSAGSVILLFAGSAVLFTLKLTRSRLPLVALCLLPVLYMASRVTGETTGNVAVNLTQQVLGTERAESLAMRFNNETALSRRALLRPAFGWGGWNRARIQDETGRDVSITDSLWIIVLGMNGVVGLTLLMLSLALPPLLLTWRVPPWLWSSPTAGAAAVLAVLLGLWMVDSALNAMIAPVYILALGGLGGLKRLAPAHVFRPVRIAVKLPHKNTLTRPSPL